MAYVDDIILARNGQQWDSRRLGRMLKLAGGSGPGGA